MAENLGKKLLNGFIFGTGFGIAFVTIWTVAFYFIVPGIIENRLETGAISQGQKEINTVPSVDEPKRFLGSAAIYSGDFEYGKSKVLSGGPGEIVGSASVNGTSAEGLKLRLALNGSVISQWATTDTNGKYRISVPYGKYTIDGFELDRNTANQVLSNKITHPENQYSSGRFEVSEENIGAGLDLRFVDPIQKRMTQRNYSISEDVMLKWAPYPKAVKYKVQIFEKDDPHSWSNNNLFEWSDRPSVSEPHVSLEALGVQLKPGKFYKFEVHARNKAGRIISETARTHSGYDFKTIE